MQTTIYHGLQESKCLSSKGDQSFSQRTSSTKPYVLPECSACFATVSLLTPATVLQKSPYTNVCKTNKQKKIALWTPDLRRCIKFCRITWGIKLRKWWYIEYVIAIKSLRFAVLLKQTFLIKWAAKDSFKSGSHSLSGILQTERNHICSIRTETSLSLNYGFICNLKVV